MENRSLESSVILTLGSSTFSLTDSHRTTIFLCMKLIVYDFFTRRMFWFGSFIERVDFLLVESVNGWVTRGDKQSVGGKTNLCKLIKKKSTILFFPYTFSIGEEFEENTKTIFTITKTTAIDKYVK